MKKAISLLLCLCVAFSLLPTSPAKATNGGSGGATTPEVTELYYAKYVYQMNGQLVQQGNIEPLTGNTLSYDIYAAPHLALYSDAAGTTRINSFSFSQTNQAVANLNRTSRGDMFLSVNPLKCGETQVTVALGNKKSFSFNLKIVMPEIGFYTSPERNENNSVKETYFTPGTEKTVYLMKNVGFTQEEATAVAIIEDKKNEVTKQVPVQISETGGYYVPFKLSAGAKDDLFFQVNSSGRGVSLLLKRDGLRYKYYNEQQAENNTEYTYSTLYLSLGYNAQIVFCYVTDGISKNVSPNELTFPNNISAEMIGSGANSYFQISAKSIGKTTVGYQSADEIKTGSMDVEAVLPDVGFYSKPEINVENFCSTLTYTPGTEASVYLMKQDGFTQEDANAVTFAGNSEYTMRYISNPTVEQIDNTGKYYLKYSTKKSTAEQVYLSVHTLRDYAYVTLEPTDVRRLMYRTMSWNQTTNEICEDMNEPMRNSITMFTDNGALLQKFYYGTTKSCVEVKNNELKFPDILDIQYTEGKNYYRVSGAKCGEGIISYTSGNNSASMNVSVTLPVVGFYKAQLRNEENCIKQQHMYKPGETTVYLLKDGGFTEQEKGNLQIQTGGEKVTLDWISNTTNSSNFDLKVTVNADVTGSFYFGVFAGFYSEYISYVEATGKVVGEYKIGDGGWQSSNDNGINIQQSSDAIYKDVKIRFKKDGQLVTPTSATLNERYSEYAQLSAGTNGVYTLTYEKLINLTIDAVFDGTSSSIEVNNWVNTANNSEFTEDGKQYVFAFASCSSYDLEQRPITNHIGAFQDGESFKLAFAVFMKTVVGNDVSYSVDMDKTKALINPTMSLSGDNGIKCTNIVVENSGINSFVATVNGRGATQLNGTATYNGTTYNANMMFYISLPKSSKVISLYDKATLTIDELNTAIRSITDVEDTTAIEIWLPPIDITANNEKNVLIGKRNIKLLGSSNNKTSTEYKRTTIHGGLIVEAEWKLNGQMTEIQGIEFDGRVNNARGKGTGISAGGTVRTKPAIQSCTFTGFAVGMNTTRLGGRVLYCNFIDNKVGLLIGETLGMERRCCNRFKGNEIAIEILENDNAQYGTAIGLSTAYIWNFVFIDNKINIKNNVNKPFYMPRALYMKTEGGNQTLTAPPIDSFQGDVVFTPYYSTPHLQIKMREGYNGPTTFLGDKLVMNKDTMSTSVEVSAITAAVSNNNPLNMEIMGRSESNEQELAAKWTFTKDGTAGAMGRATLLAETAVFDPTVTITSSTEIISAEVKSPPTGVKTSLTIPCKTMNSAVVTLNNKVVPSKWDSVSKQVSFEVAAAGIYQISPPICVSETLSGSVRNLSITINLPVTAEATAHVAVYDGSRLIEIKTVAVTRTQTPPATANIKLDTSKYPNTYKVQVLLLDNATQNPLTDKWSKQY